MQYTYEYNGETYTVTLERQADGTVKAKIGDDEYKISASQMADNGWLMRLNGERYRAYVTSDIEARYVHVNGTQYRLETVEGRRRKRKGSSTGGDLTADMPGQVIDVRVTVGDAVQAGDVLVILEAMKMEIRITAQYAGIIEKVYVQTGDVVDRGQHLVEVTAT